jgi:predicted secreted protein
MKYILTAADNNKTLDLRAGDELQITLDETPTTGYNWEVMNPAEPLYQIKKNSYKIYDEAGIGGGGRRIFDIGVTGSGTTALVLKNLQRWSGDVHEEFKVLLTIKS